MKEALVKHFENIIHRIDNYDTENKAGRYPNLITHDEFNKEITWGYGKPEVVTGLKHTVFSVYYDHIRPDPTKKEQVSELLEGKKEAHQRMTEDAREAQQVEISTIRRMWNGDTQI